MTREQLLVRKILERPLAHRWSLQGFGMLRLYLDENTRIAVWDSTHAVPDVTAVHNHPWHFESLVVSGTLYNRRFAERHVYLGQYPTHDRLRILCGEGACAVQEPVPVRLEVGPWEQYTAGQRYTQRADEVHQSAPDDGTVTIITKLGAGDHADVYVPHGQEWVDAEPRTARDHEVRDICERALARWTA